MTSERNQRKKVKKLDATKDERPQDHASPSYIVAIGGSAGGLEAFERFFAAMPADTGMAFVVVQHLDPTHKGLIPELLQRSTPMSVREVVDGVTVAANNVYVIPPNTNLSISGGRLHLSERLAGHGPHLPIDLFFESLAAECGDKSIAVIVSGMGNDGTLGLKAIKEVSGFVLVQSPESAKYDGMPRSAIDTGLVDRDATIDALPREIMDYVEHIPRQDKEISDSGDRPLTELQKIMRMLTTRTGHDFSLYKKSTLYRRIEKRASLYQLGGISEYADYLQESPEEIDALFRELLIGVTQFFRDPQAFQYLQDSIIPDLVSRSAQGGSIRIWVPACSTGEEAYSLAILLRECVDELRPNTGIMIQVFATDIDERAIEVARRGLYSTNIEADVSQQRLQRFFTKTENGYTIKTLIRETVVFAPHDLTAAPPFTKMNMVSCRNLLIYFSSELQRRILPVFHYALESQGVLFLGTAEGIGSFDELFSAIDGKWKVFRRKDTLAVQRHLREIPFRAPFVGAIKIENAATGAPVDVKEALKQTLLKRYAPPSVVVTPRGEIVLVNGKTGNYLELAEGTADWNISSMAREGLRLELPAAIHRSAAHNTVVSLKGLELKTDGRIQKVDITVCPLIQADSPGDLLVVTFEDVQSPEVLLEGAEASGGSDEKYALLQKEYAYTKERLQTTLEEMDSTSEEVKSAEEEMQSANEELQSTNEELITSKEEQQSLNEELVTLNTELQSKADVLTALNNDIVNLMNGAQVATIFLDGKLRITRFTPAVVGTFNLRSIDVGRPITDITQNLLYETIEQDIRNVQDTLVTLERQAESMDGRWFIMRIMPYQRLDNVIDGVVITFSDVTELKRLETTLLESESLSSALNVIHTEISSSLNFDDVMHTVVAKAADAIGIELGMIAECDDDRWVVRYVSGESKMLPGDRFTSEQAPYHALVAKTSQPAAIDNTHERIDLCSELCVKYGMQSILGIPLISNRKLFGVLSLISTSKPIVFTNAVMDFAHKLGLAVSLALTNSRLYEAKEKTQQLLLQQHRLLQNALIPDNPPTAPGYKVASRFIAGAAGEEVGGDFFDVFRTEDGELAILIGDVAGKGVESASLATVTRSTMRAFAYDQVAPGETLRHTNAVMLGQGLKPELFVTVFLAVLDEVNGKLRYSGGGHPPAMIRRADGSVEVIGMTQFPIGLMPDAQYEDGETQLELGDKLLMYTDGISESHSGSLMYDIGGIETTLREQGGLTPEETLEALFKAATEAGGGALSDDAAVIIVERCT